MEESIAQKAVKGTIWSACDRFGVMALQFIVNLVLARLLTPYDFGAIGMLYIFIAIGQVFIDGGFGSALIQTKKPSYEDYSTILYWNLFIGIIIYLILYLCAPLIAAFYEMEVLSDVLRWFGISLIFNGIVGLLINRLQKLLQFKIIAITNILSYIIAACISITLALNKYGVWSLVVMYISQPIIRLTIVISITRWFPLGGFSMKSFRSLVSFGFFLLLGNIIETFCKNLQGLIIGKRFSASQMGYYSQADKLDQIVSASIPQVLASVMYPVFSQYQDNLERLREIVKLDIRVLSYLIYPLLTLLIIIAEPLILGLYGDKWLSSVPYFRILCCGGFFYCLNNIPYYAVAACGQSKSLFLLSFYKWTIFGLLILIGMNFGMTGIMWAISISYFNIFIANSILAKIYTKLNLTSVLLSFIPTLIVSNGCGIILYLIYRYLCVSWILLIPIYLVLYISFSYAIRLDACRDTNKLVKNYILKQNKDANNI